MIITKEKSSTGKEIGDVKTGCAILHMVVSSRKSHVVGEEGETLRWDRKLSKLARGRAYRSLQTMFSVLLQEKDRMPLNGVSRTEVQSCLDLKRSAGCCQQNGL